MDPRLLDKLRAREEAGTLRNLQPLSDEISDFYSNDYLGLARHSVQLNQAGGTGSRLISGTTRQVLEAERTLAHFYQAEAALMFNSGYDANLGFFAAVPQRGDTILYDSAIHASIRDGIRLSFAHSIGFPHNDLAELETQLKKQSGTLYVAVESLYSMDGDFAPLEALADLCARYKAWLVVDEAHAAGIFGQDGRGLTASLESPALLARLVTFGKAYGSHGACWLGSKELMHFLVNFARSFIYTTALPESVYVHNALLVQDFALDASRQLLQKRIQCFRQLSGALNLRSDARSPIQIVEIGDIALARHVADDCLLEALGVKAIYAPTVEKGKECIRICLHAFNTESEIRTLVSVLTRALYTK
jgi:8-amino-7-oxononanoate synthase